MEASENAAAKTKWYVGFDCATKTFAFTVGRVDLDGYQMAKERLHQTVQVAQEVIARVTLAIKSPSLSHADLALLRRLLDETARRIAAADAETLSFLRIADGATVDLLPGRKDAEISTVQRLRGVARFVEGRVRESIRRHIPEGEPYRVVVEYQMTPGSPSRDVASALVALFAESDVILVGPALKNRIAICPEGRRCFFAERYSSNYAANKAHTVFNFARLEALFGTGIPPTKPASLRGHMADSFMQILGHLVHGAKENADAWY